MTALRWVQLYMIFAALEAFRTLLFLKIVSVRDRNNVDITLIAVLGNAVVWPITWAWFVAILLASYGRGFGWYREYLEGAGFKVESRIRAIDRTTCFPLFTDTPICEVVDLNPPSLVPCDSFTDRCFNVHSCVYAWTS